MIFKRDGMQFIATVPPGTRLASSPRGILVASPDAPPYILRADGSREEIEPLPPEPAGENDSPNP